MPIFTLASHFQGIMGDLEVPINFPCIRVLSWVWLSAKGTGACLQKVGSCSRSCTQVNYVNENGEVTYVHEYGNGQQRGCQYTDVLIPMMWLVTEHPPFQQKIVKDLRAGFAIDHPVSPFSQWVLQTKENIPNLFRLLLHIYI